MNSSSKLMFLFVFSTISFEINCAHLGRQPRKNKTGQVQVNRPYDMHKTYHGKDMSRGAQAAQWIKVAKKEEAADALIKTYFAVFSDHSLKRYNSVNNPSKKLKALQKKGSLLYFGNNAQNALRTIKNSNDCSKNSFPSYNNNQSKENILAKEKNRQAKKQTDLENFEKSVTDLTIAGQLQPQ